MSVVGHKFEVDNLVVGVQQCTLDPDNCAARELRVESRAGMADDTDRAADEH